MEVVDFHRMLERLSPEVGVLDGDHLFTEQCHSNEGSWGEVMHTETLWWLIIVRTTSGEDRLVPVQLRYGMLHAGLFTAEW